MDNIDVGVLKCCSHEHYYSAAQEPSKQPLWLTVSIRQKVSVDQTVQGA
jgi:hypothetical protein